MIWNQEAEQGLLGVILLRNDIYDEISFIVKAEDFFAPVHQRLFDLIKQEIEAGRKCDSVTLAPLFEHEEALKEVGGQDYIREIESKVPMLHNYKDYAETISLCAYRRRTLGIVNDIKNLLENPDQYYDPQEYISKLETILINSFDGGSSGKSAMEAYDDVIQWVQDAQGGKQVIYKSGIDSLDAIIKGFRPKGLYILGARPGMGKTACAMTIAATLAASAPVKFFSLEMSSTELMMRVLANKTGISVENQMEGRLDMVETQEIVGARNAIAKLSIETDDRSGIDVNYIVSESRKFCRKNPNGIIFIDYLGLIRSDSRLQKVHQIEEITGKLKSLAKNFNVPVVLLCQLSRALESREDKRPMLSDLRDSGSIEQDADVVMFIYREEYYLEDNPPTRGSKESDKQFYDKLNNHHDALAAAQGKAQIIIAKNRQGKKGVAHMSFDGVRQRFFDD
jgi:replicative DNA helicase